VFRHFFQKSSKAAGRQSVKRGTIFGLIQHLLKHKIKRYARSLKEDHGSPGDAYEQNLVNWFLESLEQFSKPRAFNCYMVSFMNHDFWPANQMIDKLLYLEETTCTQQPLLRSMSERTLPLLEPYNLVRVLSHHHRSLLKHFGSKGEFFNNSAIAKQFTSSSYQKNKLAGFWKTINL